MSKPTRGEGKKSRRELNSFPESHQRGNMTADELIIHSTQRSTERSSRVEVCHEGRAARGTDHKRKKRGPGAGIMVITPIMEEWS